MANIIECGNDIFAWELSKGMKHFRGLKILEVEKIILEKLDYNGNRIWDKTFGAEGDDLVSGIIKGPNNNYLIYGTSDSKGFCW